MLGSNILDIIIGMSFVFTLLSLVCSAFNELIESAVKERAKNLERGIGELVGDPGNQKGFLQQIYDHGLVNSLFKGRYEANKKQDLPSYIPARNFALALIEVVKKQPADSDVPPNVRDAFRAFEDTASKDLLRFQESIEAWYNSAMDRVAGWYKRRSQRILFGLGVLVAVGVNADAVYLARTLSTDTSLRQGLVAAAQAAATRLLPSDNKTDPGSQIRDELRDLQGLGLSLGWHQRKPQNRQEQPGQAEQTTVFDPAGWPTSVTQAWGQLTFHSFGWLLTALAISLGAPFWFDVLNKFVVVRSTVKPHEKSREEKSKDAT
jgi:hypothetical protein